MQPEDNDPSKFDGEVPVVVSRRDFFDNELSRFDDQQEEEIPPYSGDEDPMDALKRMREEAEKRTGFGG